MLAYYAVFVAFAVLGAARAITQRRPCRQLVVAESVTTITFAGPALPALPLSPDEAAARARVLFEADRITVEAYEAELDRLIAKGARLR